MAAAMEESTVRVGASRVPRTLRRRRVEAAPGSFQLSVVTWNILADGLTNTKQFPYASAEALDWERRRELIVTELLDLEADVYCLQEVQQVAFDYILGGLQEKGEFDGVYFQKPGGRLDGCATIYRSDKLNLHRWTPLTITRLLGEYFGPKDPARMGLQNPAPFGEAPALGWADSGVDIDLMIREGLATDGDHFWLEAAGQSNVAVLCELSCVESDHRILVGNTHLHWDPRLPDVKAVQMHALLQECERRMNRAAHARPDALVLVGDFNSVPCKDYSDEYDEVNEETGLISGVYELTTKGNLGVNHAHHPAKRRMLLTEEEQVAAAKEAEPVVLLPDPERDPTPAEALRKKPAHKDSISSLKNAMMHERSESIVAEEVEEKTPEVRPWTHDLGLCSAYREVCGDEPPATNITRGFEGTLDYIFYGGGGAVAAGALLLPGDDILRASEGLPNEAIPSDHVSLKAEILLPPVGPRQRRTSRSNSMGTSFGMNKRPSMQARKSFGNHHDLRGSGYMNAAPSNVAALEPIMDTPGKESPATVPDLAPASESEPRLDLGGGGVTLVADAPEFVPTFSTPGRMSIPSPVQEEDSRSGGMSDRGPPMPASFVPYASPAVGGANAKGRLEADVGSDSTRSREASPRMGAQDAQETAMAALADGEDDKEPEADFVVEAHGVKATATLLPPQASAGEQDMQDGTQDFSNCFIVEIAFHLQDLVDKAGATPGDGGAATAAGPESKVAKGKAAARAAGDPSPKSFLVDVSIRVTNATMVLEYPGLPPVTVELPAHIYPSAIETNFCRITKVLSVTAPAMAFKSPVYYVPASRGDSRPPTPGLLVPPRVPTPVAPAVVPPAAAAAWPKPGATPPADDGGFPPLGAMT